MTGSDAGWGCSSPFSLPMLSSPTGPVASFPSLLEPRQSLISRDSSPEDLGLWAFRMGEEMTELGKLLSLGVQGAGGRKGVQCWHQAPGLDGCGRRAIPCAAPSSRGQHVSSCYRKKCPRPPTAGRHLGWCWWLSFCSNLWSPLLPTVTPPGLSGQQAASSELRDNSLL